MGEGDLADSTWWWGKVTRGSKRDASIRHVIVVDFRGRFISSYQNRCLRRRTLLSYLVSYGYLCCIRDKDITATYATVVY